MTYDIPQSKLLFEFLLRHADDALVHGHRLSEWCTHAPTLEEDLAMANIAIDCLGQARLLLEFASEAEGRKRTADELCFFRDVGEYRNLLLVELPHDLDFAVTIAKQFVFDIYRKCYFIELHNCLLSPLASFSQKALKEIEYHSRYSSQWILRLADGTQISRNRIQSALHSVWKYSDELFQDDELEKELQKLFNIPSRSGLRDVYLEQLHDTLKQVDLPLPAESFQLQGGWRGLHSEEFGRMLSEMQSLARSYPGASW